MEQIAIREGDPAWERELRRRQSKLRILGEGVIVFTLWLLIEPFLFSLMVSGPSGSMEIPEDISPFIFYLFLAFFFLIFLAFALLRVYVGLAARAEGMGKRRGVGYLVWACLFFCLQILFLVLILLVLLRVGIAEGSYLQIFSTIFMEFSSAAILGEMIVAAVRLKALRRRKAG